MPAPMLKPLSRVPSQSGMARITAAFLEIFPEQE